MKKLILSSLLAGLVACGGGGGGDSAPAIVHPVKGTLLSERCEGYTRVETVADGSGGSYELSYEDSEDCGYIPPTFEVSIDDTFGDRFKPVVIEVTKTEQGEPAEWTYETDLRTEKVGDVLLVYGNGQSREETILIDDQPYLIQLSSEPRCERVGLNTDCQGYRYSGQDDGLIYYGEDDGQIVEWELVVLLYGGQCAVPSNVSGLCDDPTDDRLSNIEHRVSKYNAALERSGVHVRYKLKTVRYVETTSLSTGERLVSYLEGDIGIGLGTTCPAACGCAYANNTFRRPGFGWSICGWQTDLHEMGHSIGLAHGPFNSANAARGYVFSEFGHGWMDNLCNGSGDIMSYSANRSVFLNSRLVCSEVFESSDDDETHVTDRSYADSAYHLNRVRYDVSLVNDEHNAGTALSLREVVPFGQEEGILIID